MTYNPESRYLDSFDIDSFYERSQQEISKEVFSLDEFKDHYGETAIQKDKEYVESMENEFKRDDNPEKQESLKLATIFEATINKHLGKSEWLGPNVFTIKTSRYDDIKNGIDSVAEFRESENSASYLGLAIDVTISSDIGKKFERIKEEIREGELPKVKYFRSEHMNIKGELSKIPRVIIGAAPNTIKELAELSFLGEHKKLKNHPIQLQVLEETIAQLTAFKEYAELLGKTELALIYEKTKVRMEAIYRIKRKDIPNIGQSDNVSDVIYNNLHRFRAADRKGVISQEKKDAAKARAQKNNP